MPSDHSVIMFDHLADNSSSLTDNVSLLIVICSTATLVPVTAVVILPYVSRLFNKTVAAVAFSVPKICMIAVESPATFDNSFKRSSNESVSSFTMAVSTPYFSNCLSAFGGNTSSEPILSKMFRSAVPACSPNIAFSPSVSINATDSSTEIFINSAVVPNLTMESFIWFTVAAPACEPAAKTLIILLAWSASSPN